MGKSLQKASALTEAEVMAWKFLGVTRLKAIHFQPFDLVEEQFSQREI